MFKNKLPIAATLLGLFTTIVTAVTILNAQGTATPTQAKQSHAGKEEKINQLIDEGKITQEQVDSCQAMHQVMQDDRLDNLVTRGILTQEQADALKTLPKEKFLPTVTGEERKIKLAEKLGLNMADIPEGKGFAALVQEGKITKEQLQQAQQEIRNEQLAQAVAEGTITQIQADALKALGTNKRGKMGFGMKGNQGHKKGGVV